MQSPTCACSIASTRPIIDARSVTTRGSISGARRFLAMRAPRSAPPTCSPIWQARKSAPSLEHTFFCGHAPTEMEIRAAFDHAPDIAWAYLGDVASRERRNNLVDFMAFMTARDGVF